MSDKSPDTRKRDSGWPITFRGTAAWIWRITRYGPVAARLPLKAVAVILIAVAWVFVLLFYATWLKFFEVFSSIEIANAIMKGKPQYLSPAQRYREARRQLGNLD